MRKKGILYLIFLIVSAGLTGQDPTWDWVKTLHTNQEEIAADVVADPATGSVYLAGYWIGPLDGFIPGGGTPSTDFSSTYGGSDGLVVKFDPSGTILWAFKVGGEGKDHINAIHLDMDGNVYITGFVSPGIIHFTGTSSMTADSVFNNVGDENFFLSKYDPDGRLLWMRHSDGDNKIAGLGITSNASGVYATGAHHGTISFGPLPPYTSAGNEDMFVVKYSPDGDELWHIPGGSSSPDYGEDITCDETHIYVTGEFEGSMLSLRDATGEIISTLINTNDGKTDVFIASYTIDGLHQWMESITSEEDNYCFGITMDSDSLYLAGSIGAPALFPLFSGNPVFHSSEQDAFVCSMSKSNGGTGWVRTLRGAFSGDQVARDISMDIAGSLYVTGYYQLDISNMYDTFDSKGDEDIFLVSYTDQGDYRWLKTAGSDKPDFGNGVSATAPGSIYLAGDYEGLASFDTILVPDDGNTNIYLARLQLPCLDAVGGVLSTTDTIVCEADTVSLVLRGYLGDIEWQTSPPGMNTWSSLTADVSDSIAVVPAFSADYRVFVRSGSCAPDSSNVVNVQVRLLPSANISGDTTKCNDGTTSLLQVELTGTPPWDLVLQHDGISDTTISGISINPYLHEVSQEGIYTLVSVSDIHCEGKVFGSASLVYIEYPTPDPGIGGDVCGLEFTLQAIPSTAIGSWSLASGPGSALFTPSPDSANVTVTVTDYGSYEFKWTETNGPCTGDSSVVVRFFLQPIIALIPGGQICGMTYGLNVTTNTGTGTWLVLNGPGNVVFLPDEQAPDAIAQVDTYGTYTFEWSVVNGICSATAVTDVEFLEVPDADAGSDMTIEVGEVVRLTGTGGDSVIWTPNYRLSDPAIPDPLADPLITTIYYLTVFSQNGCAGTDSVVITVRPPDFAVAGEDVEICPGDSTQLKASGGELFKWEPPDGLDRSDIPDPWAKPGVTTTYVVSVTRADGITDTDTVIVVVLPRPFVDAGEDQSVCLGDEVQLSATGMGEFRWNLQDLLSDPTLRDPVAMMDVTTTFWVRITDVNGCRNFDDVTIFVFEPPVPDAGPDQEYIARYETTLEARLGRDEKGTWSVLSGNGIFEDPHSPVTWVSDLVTGDNIFAWSVTNGVCPEVSDRVNIRVEDFIIPSVITPNGDGKNDHFHVEGIRQFTSSELMVLNRWGEEVYRSSPYLNDWDGADSKGRELPEDTYYTILKIKNGDVRKGYVVIIR